jgi:uncharacterized protein (DUF433 family)
MKQIGEVALAVGVFMTTLSYSEVAGRPTYVPPSQSSSTKKSLAGLGSNTPQIMPSNLITTSDACPNLSPDIKALAEMCLDKHPGISIDPLILGGIPHIEDTRLSVGQVVGRVRALGSIQAVVEYYRGSVTEPQIKEALAYAQEFIERACDPYQTYG